MKKQITLRIPKEVHEALKVEASQMNLTLNELILIKINPIRVNFGQLKESHFLSQSQ